MDRNRATWLELAQRGLGRKDAVLKSSTQAMPKTGQAAQRSGSRICPSCTHAAVRRLLLAGLPGALTLLFSFFFFGSTRHLVGPVKVCRSRNKKFEKVNGPKMITSYRYVAKEKCAQRAPRKVRSHCTASSKCTLKIVETFLYSNMPTRIESIGSWSGARHEDRP